MKKNNIQNLKITKLDNSRLEIIGSILIPEFQAFRKQALENINNEITIDGFRKGKIPENILISKVGEMTVLEEMAELALSKIYPQIIIDEKIDAIGHPEINITKLAKDNPLEFKIITAIMPEINIADYKKIAKEKNKNKEEIIEVTEKEVEEALIKIKESHKDHEGHDHDSPESKEEIKKYLLENKKLIAQDKRRIELSDAILHGSSIIIPELLINSEVRRIEAQFSDDLSRMKVKLEDYMKHAKKSIEDLRKEWRPHAEKKAKLQLILNKIASLEKINVDKNKIEDEVKHILSYYKDADQEQAYIYAETVLMNQMVYEFLESQK